MSIGNVCIVDRGVSRTTAKSKMEFFVTKVNDFQPLTFVTKSSILDFAIVLDMPLSTIHTFPIDMKQNLLLTSNYTSAF